MRAWRRRFDGLVLGARAAVARATARPRQWASPVTSVLSPAAWALLFVGVVGFPVGQVLGWDELRIVSVLALLVLVICVVFVLGSNRAQARVDLSRTRVVVGERATGRLLVTNPGSVRILPLLVELPVGTGLATFDLPSLRGGATHEELFVVPTQRRAILDLGPVRAVRTDPFEVLRRDRELTDPELLHVHPRTVGLESSATGFVRDLEGLTVRKLSDNDVAFHALREYVPGDDRRFVHWKSTARTGTLMVRQFEETRRSHLLVTLSTRLDNYASDDEFELAVSVAASLGAQSLRDGHTLSVLTSLTAVRSDHATGLLDQLSGVDYEPMAPQLHDTLRTLGRQVFGASVAMLLCGSTTDPADLRRSRRRLAPDLRAIALRMEPGQDASLRVMGDLEMVTLGSLDDLPAMVRRLAR